MTGEELVRLALARLEAQDYARLAELMAPDMHWFAEIPGPWDCESRDQVLRVLAERRPGDRWALAEVREGATGRYLVHAVAREPEPDRPVDRYMVVTVGGGRLVEMRGCRDEAEAAERAGLRPLKES